jgi:hypothetical protein
MQSATATNSNDNTAAAAITADDIVRRGIKRELPCKLTDEEFTRIARQRATKEAELAQLQADLAREKKKRMDQIEELGDEVSKMGRELHTGEQDRTVPCNDMFRRADDGTGWIHTIRQDTHTEVERRPATAHETQRYLPTVGDDTKGGLIEQASQKMAEVERSAQDETDDVPPSSDDEADEADDEGSGEKKPRGKGKKR